MLAPDMVLDDAGPVEIDPDAAVLLEPVPPDESFWKKHSSHLEFPQSLLASTFLVACMFGMVVLCLYLALGDGPTKRVPPISLAGGGESDSGDGNRDAGAAGGANGDAPLAPTTVNDPAPTITPEQPTEIADVKQPAPVVEAADPTGPLPTATSKYDAFVNSTADKLLQGPGGPGSGKGKSGDGKGEGEFGPGRDGSRARSLRWIIKFVTSGGQDYLNQLSAMSAVVLVPVPNKPGQYYLFTDLKNPKFGAVASDADMVRYSGQVQFCDTKPESVRGVGQALGLPFSPTEFYAVFPAGIENELVTLERQFAGRKSEDIKETRFQVDVIGGRHKFRVVSQEAK